MPGDGGENAVSSGSSGNSGAYRYNLGDRQKREQRLSYLRYRTQISRENQPEDEEEPATAAINNGILSPGSSPPRSAFSPVALLSGGGGGTCGGATTPVSGGGHAYPRYIPRPSVLSLGKPRSFAYSQVGRRKGVECGRLFFLL